MTDTDTEVPFEASEADVIEQRQAIIDDGEFGLPADLPLADADPADALDQLLAVPFDDDDWPSPSR